jgi:Bacterial protein of unknown function (DUF937)
MAVNLAELVKGYLTPDILQKAGSFVGESESATQKAMNGIIPALIAALTNRASTPSGAEKLSQMLDAGKYDGSTLNNLGSLFSGRPDDTEGHHPGQGYPECVAGQPDRRSRGSDRALCRN